MRLLLVIFASIAFAACGHGQSTTSSTTTTTATTAADSSPSAGADATTAPDAASTANADASAAPDTANSSAGVGHIETTGMLAFANDFKVAQCLVSKPGEGLLNGYQMHSGGDRTANEAFATVFVRASDYTKDGTYDIAPKSAEAQAGQMMTNPMSAALTLMVAKAGAQAPAGLTATPRSTVSITISNNGAKGEAKFTKFQDLLAAASQRMSGKSNTDTDIANLALVDGTITWSCEKVDHLGDKMGGAVNNMFNAIMGNKKNP